MVFFRKNVLKKMDVFPRRLMLDALNSISEGFALYDEKTRIVLWNQKFIEIFPSIQDLVERGEPLSVLAHKAMLCGDIVIPSDVPPDWIHQLVKDREKSSSVFEYQLADGRWMRARSHKIASGGTVVIFRDVSETKTREETLRHARDMADASNRTKSAFLAHVSHELRTPLNAIIGFSEIMEKEIFGPIENPQYKEYVGDILKSAQHLLGVIDDILNVSKAEVGQMDLRESVMEVSHLVEEVVRMITPRADAAGVFLLKEVIKPLPSFVGDERKIRQILINLLTNAIKFTPEGGRVVIGVKNDKGLVLTVKDTGVGMSSENISQAFEAFSQFEPHLSRQHEGVGLGLHLTDGFVRAHGGVIHIDSTLGKGTEVTVCFPEARCVVKDANRAA